MYPVPVRAVVAGLATTELALHLPSLARHGLSKRVSMLGQYQKEIRNTQSFHRRVSDSYNFD